MTAWIERRGWLTDFVIVQVQMMLHGTLLRICASSTPIAELRMTVNRLCSQPSCNARVNPPSSAALTWVTDERAGACGESYRTFSSLLSVRAAGFSGRELPPLACLGFNRNSPLSFAVSLLELLLTLGRLSRLSVKQRSIRADSAPEL